MALSRTADGDRRTANLEAAGPSRMPARFECPSGSPDGYKPVNSKRREPVDDLAEPVLLNFVSLGVNASGFLFRHFFQVESRYGSRRPLRGNRCARPSSLAADNNGEKWRRSAASSERLSLS